MFKEVADTPTSPSARPMPVNGRFGSLTTGVRYCATTYGRYVPCGRLFAGFQGLLTVLVEDRLRALALPGEQTIGNGGRFVPRPVEESGDRTFDFVSRTSGRWSRGHPRW